MILQKLIIKYYLLLMEIFLWLFPIGGGIAGYHLFGFIYGFGWFRHATSEQHFMGVIVGILVGIVLDILWIGPKIILYSIKHGSKK